MVSYRSLLYSTTVLYDTLNKNTQGAKKARPSRKYQLAIMQLKSVAKDQAVVYFRRLSLTSIMVSKYYIDVPLKYTCIMYEHIKLSMNNKLRCATV